MTGWVDAERVGLACDCAVTPVLVSERGEPLRVGRTFSGSQRRALVLRDRQVHEGGFQLVRRPDGTWAAVRDPRPP